MTARARVLTLRQYTDMVMVIGVDHVAAAAGEALVVLAIPALWIAGVIVFIALKLRAR